MPQPAPQRQSQPNRPSQPAQVPVPTLAESRADVEYPTGKSKRGLIAMVVVLVAIASAAGAYFGGVIPH